MRKIILSSLLLFVFLIPSLSKAQCGFDAIREKQLLDPAFVLQEQENELRIKNFIPPTNITGKAGSVLTIPVVVHVLHKGEAVGSGTNISDAQIQSAIDRLNEVYRGLDPNSPIDFEIEFSLAQRDPNCNATNGINRVLATGVAGYSASGVFMQSVGADENELKDLSKWPETDYCNIWIVSEIDNNGGGAGIQGYANFFNGNSYEGSVMMASVFGYDPGNTNGWGLNSNGDGGTVVHEFGHYFHLYHTFQGDDANASVTPYPGYSAQCPGDAVVGTDSDGCSDTEIHKRLTSTCPTNNDCNGGAAYGINTRNNYMSYFSCTDRLTADQKTRVTGAMTGTSIVASKGALAPDPGYAAPVAVCATNTVTTTNAGIISVELNGTTFSSFSSSSDGGNIDKSANCSGYFEIDASVSNTLNVGMYTVNFQQLGVWIDWNDDGDFNDDAEQQHLSQDIASSTTVPIVLTYPASIPYDDYVRVRLITDLDDRYGPGIINSPCYSSIQYGQSEDYAIYVQPAAGSAPVADFSVSDTTVCKGSSVTFSDLSTNTPTSWSWSFAGGTPATSTSQNPSVTYNNAGTFSVTLTATNAFGSDPETKTSFITVNDLPDVSSTSSTDETCAGSDGTATVSPGAGTYTYSWNTAPVQTSATATGLVAATYNVTVTNTTTTCFASTDVVVADACLAGEPGPYFYGKYCNKTIESNEYSISTAISGATKYEFQLVDPVTSVPVSSLERIGKNYFKLDQMSGWDYNTTYNLRVRAYVNSSWTDYGSTCSITTPSFPLPKIYGKYCNKIVSSSDYMVCTTVPNGTKYEFQLVDPVTSVPVSSLERIGKNYFKLDQMSGWDNNTTYNVRVRAFVGYWMEYGLDCSITTSSASIFTGDAVARLANNNEFEEGIVPATFTIYPNPNQGEYLFVELVDLFPNSELIVTDIYGKQIERMIIDTEESNYNTTVRFTNKLTSGFYLVTVKSNGQSTTKKLIVR